MTGAGAAPRVGLALGGGAARGPDIRRQPEQPVIAGKLEHCRPDVLLRPPVSRFRVLDFLKVDAVLAETAGLKEEAKRAVAAAFARWEARSR